MKTNSRKIGLKKRSFGTSLTKTLKAEETKVGKFTTVLVAS